LYEIGLVSLDEDRAAKELAGTMPRKTVINSKESLPAVNIDSHIKPRKEVGRHAHM
jgi:hypothetical protein